MTKFRKFQRPVDFEPKLTHVKRMLDEIEERIHLIEIRSEDPDVMQAQLEHCMVSGIYLSSSQNSYCSLVHPSEDTWHFYKVSDVQTFNLNVHRPVGHEFIWDKCKEFT